MSTTHSHAPRFKVGSWASFDYGPRRICAQIIEDRGPIGVNGRRLYRVQLGDEKRKGTTFEVPEDELAEVEFDREKVLQYLNDGGLVSILRSNLGGGRSQPKVWLAFDRDGNAIHTFVEERGAIGGKTVPFFALQENRIFGPKSHDVIEFLSSFGLSKQEAEGVVQSIGTLP